MNRKRGRPRLDRPKYDFGTPELIKKRMTIAPDDPTRSTNPIDACAARGIISDEAHSAAIYFRALRKIVFGKAIPPAIDLNAVSSNGNPDEPDRGDAETKYREACAAMKCQSRPAFDAVENLVVHERWPEWLFAGQGKRVYAMSHFTLGVAALLGWYKGMRRKAA